MNICVIPARGGSKRIPLKNIKYFCGKPIIIYSIENAIKADCFSRIIVSTDNEEIKAISISNGADVPFIRPKTLSDDYSTSASVVKHAIEWLQSKGEKVENVCCLYPTAPFVSPLDLNKGLKKLEENKTLYALPVIKYSHPPQRGMRIKKEENVLEMISPSNSNIRSQDLEEIWHDAGQYCWGKVEAWLNEISILSSNPAPIKLSHFEGYDIDTEEDWCHAEHLFNAFQLRSF